jgi:hypothetical protein
MAFPYLRREDQRMINNLPLVLRWETFSWGERLKGLASIAVATAYCAWFWLTLIRLLVSGYG